jgi:hypothetical protein
MTPKPPRVIETEEADHDNVLIQHVRPNVLITKSKTKEKKLYKIDEYTCHGG